MKSEKYTNIVDAISKLTFDLNGDVFHYWLPNDRSLDEHLVAYDQSAFATNEKFIKDCI